ncbi:MAG: dephospho-CoA kinase [Atopobiaceae bacterium]|nr:dephospho-CoA kinase [Atopobiaceae bacterium]MBR1830176.1 dephospho-CoA kinase [Atopobiaceae bacterium]
MYTVFLAGGIASGKSTVAAELERLGAWRVDLDQISREVLEPGTATTFAVAEAFGQDLLDPDTGVLDRRLLASRAFVTRESVALLEALELPAIRARLAEVLTSSPCGAWEPACCVVEIPLLDRMEDSLGLADEVVVVDLPVDVRRERAIGRGMTAADFDARAANQPSDEWLVAHADTLIHNGGTLEDLIDAVAAWWHDHESQGWKGRGGAAYGRP